MMADPELQFSVDPNKSMCAGEISGSLLVLSQQILSTAQVSITLPLDTIACKLLLLSHFSRVQLCVTPEVAAHQAPPSLGFSRQEHWSGVPFPSPMHESEK